MKRLALAAVAALALAAAGCGGDGSETLRLVADAGTSETADVATPGRSVGDVYVFNARVFDEEEQQEVGHLDGTQTSIRLEDDVEVVQTLMTFSFGGRDTITVGGVGRYPRSEVGLVRGREQVRPILGGTGKYEGATGQDTTVRRPDGLYEHTLDITN